MAFFIAAGVISNDVIRRETQKGVLTTFRLETGAPRGGKLWIDIECWGHLAGTIARHATKGRGVSVSGRLIQKTWRDKTTGDARHRYVITANDIDLHPPTEATTSPLPNNVLLIGTVTAVYPPRETTSGTVFRFKLKTRRPSIKAGRLEVTVNYWRPKGEVVPHLEPSDLVELTGHLGYDVATRRSSARQIRVVGQSLAVRHASGGVGG